jgi:peptide/nickel transport system substrate-binding protein
MLTRLFTALKRRGSWSILLLVMLAFGCAAPQANRLDDVASAPQPAKFKRVVGAILGDPAIIYRGQKITLPAPAGNDELEELVMSGLTGVSGDDAHLVPKLAEIVPSIENGLWVVFPDGRMETTWKLRPNARWHDGTPFTSADLVFTATVVQDRDLPMFREPIYSSVESVVARDPLTLVVTWKQTQIFADTLFQNGPVQNGPFPRHLLEAAYVDSKATFTNLPYWGDEFVGTGPFRLREWVRGSHAVLSANDDYVLGRPKIDELVVKFIPETNALMANILAGEVEVTLGRTLLLDQALQVRDQWADGHMDISFKSWLVASPQLITPSPTIIGDARFRKALIYAMDRHQLSESFQGGLVPVADSYLQPNQPQYREIEDRIMRYEYDPRRAGQVIQDLGYAKGPDDMFRDGSGQPLGVEIRGSGVDGIRPILAIADYWRRAGVATDTVAVPPQRQLDKEYISTYPGFHVNQRANDVGGLATLHSSNAALPENNWTGEFNVRYINPEFDSLINRFYGTIPQDERTQVLGQIIYHVSDQLNLMGLYYGTRPVMIGNRLLNVAATKAPFNDRQSWNAQDWDVAS